LKGQIDTISQVITVTFQRFFL